LASAQTPATNLDRLRTSGIEASAAGAKAWLETLVATSGEVDVDALIEQLADQNFDKRERATQELVRSGKTSQEKLRAAAESSDPERALRAKLILKSRETPKESPLLFVLQAAEQEKWPLGLPLLLKVRARAATPAEQEAAARAMVATVVEKDGEVVEELLKSDDVAMRNIGRRLSAKLKGPIVIAPLLEGAFDAVVVKPGTVAGGGRDLIQGWEFKPKADLTVTHLGIYDDRADGLKNAHGVAIWDVEDVKKSVTAETIPDGELAPLAGMFRCVPVAPAKLKAGRRYAIVAHYPEAADTAVSMLNPSGLTIDYAAHLEVFGRRYAFPHKEMAFPDKLADDPLQATIGPTMRYEVSEKR
jgi:hypothetical protein